MTLPLTGISSMATRALLADLSAAFERTAGRSVRIEAAGGVDAAKRVQAGEAIDAVFLASDVIDKLMAGGSVLAGSKVDLVRSGVSVAVPAGAPLPKIASAAELRTTLLAASSIGYSTGPSGMALLQLFEQWGIAQELAPRLVQAPAGVPVGALVAERKVTIGFQQTSELIHVAGITVVGPLPAEVQIITIFSGGVCAASQQPDATRELLRYLASPTADAAIRAQGMEPAAR